MILTWCKGNTAPLCQGQSRGLGWSLIPGLRWASIERNCPRGVSTSFPGLAVSCFLQLGTMWALNNSLAPGSASEQKRQSSRPAACMCSLFFPPRPSFCKYVFRLRGGGSGHRTQALGQESAICIQMQLWTCFSEPHFFARKMVVTGGLPLLGGSREVLP